MEEKSAFDSFNMHYFSFALAPSNWSYIDTQQIHNTRQHMLLKLKLELKLTNRPFFV